MGKNIFKYLLYSVSAIFYIFAIIAILNAFYDAMFFLIMDGILFGVAGYYVGKIMEDEDETKEQMHHHIEPAKVENINAKSEPIDEIESIHKKPVREHSRKKHKR